VKQQFKYFQTVFLLALTAGVMAAVAVLTAHQSLPLHWRIIAGLAFILGLATYAARQLSKKILSERLLKRERDFTNLVLDTAGASVIILDRDGRVARINPAFSQISGFSESAVVGKLPWSLVDSNEERRMLQSLFSSIGPDSPPSRKGENYFITKDGSRRLIAWSASIVRDKMGGLKYVVGAAVDVTGQAEAREIVERRKDNLDALRELSLECAKADPQVNLYQLLADKLKVTFGAVAATISLYDPKSKALNLKHISIASGDLIKIAPFLNQTMDSFNVPVSPDIYEVMLKEVVRKSADLTEVTFGMISPADSSAITQLLKIGEIAGMALRFSNEIQGTAVVFMEQGKPPLSTELLHVFAHVAAVAVRRKRAEEQLEEKNRFLEGIINGTSEGIFVLDENQRYVLVNPASRTIMAMNDSDVLGKTAGASLHPDDRTEALRCFKKTLGGEHVELELRAMDSGGNYHYLHLKLAPLKRVEGNRVIGLVRDVTEKKRAEQALLESEEHFRRMAESAQDIIFRWSFQKGLEYVNPAVKDITGYHAEELLGDPALVFKVVQSSLPALKKEYEAAVEQGKPFGPREFQITRKDWSPAFLDLRSVNVQDQSGKIIAIEGIIRDVTESRQMEMRLKNAAWEWRKTFDTLSETIMIVDRENRILRVNEAASKLLGLPYKDILGKICHQVVHNSNSPILFCPHSQTIHNGLIHTVEIQEPRFAKEFEITTSPMTDENGNITASVHVMRDVTERNRIEREMIRGQKLESLGVLAGGIAHDFNNILTVVLANISIAKKEIVKDTELFETLNEIETASIQAKNLTRQLLTFSKGGMPIKRPVDLGGLVREAAGFSLRGSNVKCEFLLPADLWWVEADEGQLTQVINNLVINAAQAMPGGGHITISAANIIWEPKELAPAVSLTPGQYLKLSVRDRGVGISPENLHKIFDPYFTTKTKGSGLGLATVYSIIKKHGGYIDVESTEGSGACFHVYLPAAGERPEPERHEQIPSSPGHGKILFMDDEPQIRNSVSKVLKGFGYEVECAENGARAIELYLRARESGQPFDAVVMDLTVPGGMGGTDAIRRLRQLDPQVKAIIASGYANSPVMADFKNYGFLDVITKPFQPAELDAILKRLIK